MAKKDLDMSRAAIAGRMAVLNQAKEDLRDAAKRYASAVLHPNGDRPQEHSLTLLISSALVYAQAVVDISPKTARRLGKIRYRP